MIELDDVFEAMREVYEIAENNMIIVSNVELMRDIKKEDWFTQKKKEYTNLTDKLNKIGEQVLKQMNSSTKTALKLSGVKNDKLLKDNEKAIGLLITSAKTYYTKTAKKLSRLKNTDKLYEGMLKQAVNGFEKGLKITYKNGRNYGFKEYMEMSVRTTINNEIVQNQLNTQNVFYTTNEFADCADDHKDYQGKIYYDERYLTWNLKDEMKKLITDFIKKNKLISMQKAIGENIWLSTRPNCRHKFFPLTIEQVLNNKIDKVKKDNYLKRGTYKDYKYKITQRLRLCERNVRKYKDLAKQFEMMPKDRNTVIQTNHYMKLANAWENEIEKLVKKYDWLERDKRRETRTAIVQDLGISYGNR